MTSLFLFPSSFVLFAPSFLSSLFFFELLSSLFSLHLHPSFSILHSSRFKIGPYVAITPPTRPSSLVPRHSHVPHPLTIRPQVCSVGLFSKGERDALGRTCCVLFLLFLVHVRLFLSFPAFLILIYRAFCSSFFSCLLLFLYI